MMAEQHERVSPGYYPFHHKRWVFRDIALWFRLYELDYLLSGQNSVVNSVFDIKLVGYVDYLVFLEPPPVDPNIEEDETDLISIATTDRLNLRPIAFTEEDDLLHIRKHLLHLFPIKSLLEVNKERGRHLSVTCPATEVGGKLVLWLPENTHVSPIDFLIDLPSIDAPELRASIVPDNK